MKRYYYYLKVSSALPIDYLVSEPFLETMELCMCSHCRDPRNKSSVGD
jgi:hypothetical protein